MIANAPVAAFAKGIGDVGISAAAPDTAGNRPPNATEPVSDQFLGVGYQSMSEDPEPGTAPSDWFGSNAGSWAATS